MKMNFAITDNDIAELPVDEQVVLFTRKVQAANPKLSYVEASELALSANPKLAKAYADSNGCRDGDGNVVRPNYEE